MSTSKPGIGESIVIWVLLVLAWALVVGGFAMIGAGLFFPK